MELKTTRFLILFLFEPRLYTLFFETIKAFAFRIDSRLNFFFGSMLLRSFNDESSEVIAKDFFNLYFFPFWLVKKEVYGAVFEISVASCHRGPLSSFLSSPFLFLLTLVSFVEHLGRLTLLPAP